MIDVLKKAEENRGWVTDNIKVYRHSINDPYSVYVFTDKEDFNADDADALLGDNGISADFIEMDDSVANYNGFKYCFVFHKGELK